jgi:hypothetical protein
MAFENVIVKCLLCLQLKKFQYFSIPKKLAYLFKLKIVSCNIYISVKLGSKIIPKFEQRGFYKGAT